MVRSLENMHDVIFRMCTYVLGWADIYFRLEFVDLSRWLWWWARRTTHSHWQTCKDRRDLPASTSCPYESRQPLGFIPPYPEARIRGVQVWPPPPLRLLTYLSSAMAPFLFGDNWVNQHWVMLLTQPATSISASSSLPVWYKEKKIIFLRMPWWCCAALPSTVWQHMHIFQGRTYWDIDADPGESPQFLQAHR